MSNDTKTPAPLELDVSFMSPVGAAPTAVPAAVPLAEPAPAPVQVEATPAAPAAAETADAGDAAAQPEAAAVKHPADGLEPIDMSLIPEKFRKHVDAAEEAPVRMMAARAMVPMGPKDMVHVLYQCIFDPEPKIGQLAKRSFVKLDDRIIDVVVNDATIAPPVLLLLARSLIKRADKLEQVLLNRATPDAAYVIVGEKCETQGIIELVASNQERLLREHDIVRAVSNNPAALRSDVDRAVDFLVREGVFLEDVPAFEDAFLRLGKMEMLDAIKKIKIEENKPTVDDIAKASELGISPEAYVEEHGSSSEDGKIPLADRPWNDLTLPERLRECAQGSHERAIVGLKSQNRMIARAAIENPKIKIGDIEKVLVKGQIADVVVRVICKNRDWTKNYKIQLLLCQHPKTPPSIAMRWLAGLRLTDVKKLAKSRQVPGAVQAHAKKMVSRKMGGR